MSKQASKEGYNPWHDIDSLPLTDDQKEIVLEYLARKLWIVSVEGMNWDYHCKSYDPLLIEENTAHSYVLNLGTSGRHHYFKNYKELEQRMVDGVIEDIQNKIKYLESHL